MSNNLKAFLLSLGGLLAVSGLSRATGFCPVAVGESAQWWP
jgi:hypothetical protein